MRVFLVAAGCIAALALTIIIAVSTSEPNSTKPGGTNGVVEYVEIDTNNGDSVGCVVWDGYKSGGISCDWSNAN